MESNGNWIFINFYILYGFLLQKHVLLKAYIHNINSQECSYSTREPDTLQQFHCWRLNCVILVQNSQKHNICLQIPPAPGTDNLQAMYSLNRLQQ